MTIERDWEPYHPSQLAGLLKGLSCPWWIAGGWALELFAGRPIRDHEDLDIETPRGHFEDVAEVLCGWDLQVAHAGVLEPWEPGRVIPPQMNGLWCRPHRDEPWRLQIMLATTRGEHWFYRRDERVWREFADVGIENSSGLPVLAPEIQLLYKSRNVRPKDQLDFDTIAGLLGEQRRTWLLEALTLTAPDHIWIGRLQTAGETG